MPKVIQSPLITSLEKLKSVSDRLNELSDEINDAFKIVETNLQDSSIGIETSVNCDSEFPDWDPSYHYYLVFKKYKNAFRILFFAESTDSDSANELTPWSELPRTTKLKLVKILPTLVETIANNVNELLKDAVEADNALKTLHNLKLGGNYNEKA